MLGVTISNREIVGDDDWRINEELDEITYFHHLHLYVLNRVFCADLWYQSQVPTANNTCNT